MGTLAHSLKHKQLLTNTKRTLTCKHCGKPLSPTQESGYEDRMCPQCHQTLRYAAWMPEQGRQHSTNGSYNQINAEILYNGAYFD